MESLSPSLHIRPGEALATPRRVEVSTEPLQDLVQVDFGEYVGGFQLNINGFRLADDSAGDATMRVNWQLFAGDDCDLDDEPCWQGSTFLTPGDGLVREGLLVQLGRFAKTFFLRGYCTKVNADYTLSFAVRVVALPQSYSGPRVVTGPVLG